MAEPTSYHATYPISSELSMDDTQNIALMNEEPRRDEMSTTSGSSTASEWNPNKQIWFIIAGQSCCVFVIALDSTILTASLPTVARALNANAVKAYWFITAYLLASAVIQPLTAALADVFGRRSTFFASLLLFTIGTIICCTSDGVAQMLAGRTVQGLGGGGMLSVNLIILSDIIPLRQRSKYVGLVQVINSLAINLGPVIGAALIKVTWRWLFYINFPFCGIGLAVIPFLLRYVSAEQTFYDKLGQIDWVGCGLFIVGSTMFLIGLSWGGNEYAWGSAATLVPLILGLITVCCCVVYEAYVARNPFLRLSIFRSYSAIAVYICTVLSSLTLFTELYFLTLFLLTTKLYSPLVSATVILAFAFAVVPVSGITGTLITKIGGYRWAIFCGWLINTFGIGALMILGPDSYVPGLCFVFIVAGIGQGMLFMAHQVASQASCKVKDVAYAAAMFSFARSFGFCLGIALGGTIFQNLLRSQLSLHDLPTAIAADAEGFASVLRSMAAGIAKQTIVEAYGHAFRHLFATMTGISGLGLVLSFAIGEHSLDIEHDATHKLRSRDEIAMKQSPQATMEKRSAEVC